MLTTYTEGRIIYITYFSQQFDATDVQSNVVDLSMLTKDDVHIAWTQIRNFELRVKSEFEFNWDYDTNNAEFKGEGIVFPRFVPKIGDIFLYKVRDKYGIFYISDVARLAIGQDTYHSIKFTMQEYLTPIFRDRLGKQSTRIVYFDRTKYLAGNTAMLTSEEYGYKKDLEHLRSEIIEDYMERFYSTEFSTFIRPDSIYDPYIVEYWNTKVGITETMQQIRPTQLLISVSNFKKTIWATLTSHPIKDLSHVDRYSNTETFQSTFWGANITALLGHKFLTVGNEAKTYDDALINSNGNPIFYDPTTIFYQRTPYDQVQKRVHRFFAKSRQEFFDKIYPDLGFKYHHPYIQQPYPVHSDAELIYIWKIGHGYADTDEISEEDVQRARGYVQWYRETYPGTLSDIELTTEYMRKRNIPDLEHMTEEDRQHLIDYIAAYRSKWSSVANKDTVPNDTGKLSFLYYPIHRSRDTKKNLKPTETIVDTNTYALSYAFYTGDWENMSTVEQLVYAGITNGELNIGLIVDVVKDYLEYDNETAYYNHLFLLYLIDKALYWLKFH